jgi:branched-chain amino acid transport system ATP-binding protein
LALLEGQGLSKRFGGVTALDGVNFAIEQGTIVGLIGPNGAGKTTLFNVVAGMFRPDSGRVLFKGKDVTNLPATTICHLGIARTFQVTRPFAKMTCVENVAVAMINSPRSSHGREWRRAAGTYLDYVELGPLASTEARYLNVIQKKRLEIARALATEPELLMLDEVLGGLNTQEIGRAVDFIKRLRDERRLTICWIEHVMGAIMEAADKVIVLEQGKHLMEGPPDAVVKDQRVIEAYLGE